MSTFAERFKDGTHQDVSPEFAKRVLRVARKRPVQLTPERLGRISHWMCERCRMTGQTVDRRDAATLARLLLAETWRHPEDAPWLTFVLQHVLQVAEQ